MTARIIIPTAAGDRVSYDLVTGRDGVQIVFATSEERFERWLFYLLREMGAHVVTDKPDEMRRALGLGSSEAGVVDEHEIEDLLLNRNPATA
jgi:hypothetical protein